MCSCSEFHERPSSWIKFNVNVKWNNTCIRFHALLFGHFLLVGGFRAMASFADGFLEPCQFSAPMTPGDAQLSDSAKQPALFSTGESGLSAVYADVDVPADLIGSPSSHDAVIDQHQDADDEAAPGDLKGFRKRWSKRRKVTEETEYSPSLLQEQFPPEPPVERLLKTSSRNDDSASLVNAFVDRITPSAIVMPWESAFMAPIFGSQFCESKLSMPAQWSETFADPLKHAMPEATPDAVAPVDFSVLRCIRNLADMDFIQAREKKLANALVKIKCVLEINWDASGVGRQCLDSSGAPRPDMEDTLTSVIGTRSPSTIVKRCNAVLAYHRWLATWADVTALPFSEPLVWDYLGKCGAAATKAMSFIQTLRFCQHVLQVDGADQCAASRRLVGQSELQAALKGPTKQARPLTVMEVRKLQKFMADPSKELQERLICSHLVLMIYTRSRNSDLAYVEGISLMTMQCERAETSSVGSSNLQLDTTNLRRDQVLAHAHHCLW